MKSLRYKAASAFLGLFLLSIYPVLAAEEKAVSCVNLPVNAAPSAFSGVVCVLDYGTVVLLEEEVQNGFFAPSAQVGEKMKIPGWYRIVHAQGDGYVPAGVLVSKGKLGSQDPEKAVSGEDFDAMCDKASRGFSENEDDANMKAMKGVAGEAKSLDADYDAVQRILDASPEENDAARDAEFRREGALGEYKNEEVNEQ